jgi:hypothetical protein
VVLVTIESDWSLRISAGAFDADHLSPDGHTHQREPADPVGLLTQENSNVVSQGLPRPAGEVEDAHESAAIVLDEAGRWGIPPDPPVHSFIPSCISCFMQGDDHSISEMASFVYLTPASNARPGA